MNKKKEIFVYLLNFHNSLFSFCVRERTNTQLNIHCQCLANLIKANMIKKRVKLCRDKNVRLYVFYLTLSEI
jgi:hypothetical protein